MLVRRDVAASVAAAGGLVPQQFDAGRFVLAGWTRPAGAHAAADTTLVVYLEGDGLTWVTPAQLAKDPTPTDPLALRLAAADPARRLLYLARPCQYVTGEAARNCRPFYWSSGRLAPEVVAAVSQAIDAAKAASGATRIELVGYSGGGALAVLVAARRDDVVRIVTVAADLALAAWTSLHQVSPMTHSLDPVAVAAELAGIPQVHYVGGEDEVVPAAIVATYRKAAGEPAGDLLITVPGYTHTCCWARTWPSLIARARALASPAAAQLGAWPR